MMGLGYQQNLNFVDLKYQIMQHNKYVLVVIKHFLKWLELVSSLIHSNETTIYAFFDKVFNKFGALAKIFIEQGMIFYGEFQ